MICWFCSLREAQERHTYGIDMYGEVDARKTAALTDVAYRVRHVEVPRCADCHRRHNHARNATILGVVFIIVAIGAILSIVFSWTTPLVSGLWLGLSVGLALASVLAARLIQRGIHPLRKSHSKHPEVQELLKQCYRFGQRPKAGIPKSSKPCNEANNDDSQAG